LEREPSILRDASAELAAHQREFSWDLHLAQVSDLLARARSERGEPSHVFRPARRILHRPELGEHDR
jgi:hypothetical protein